MGLGCLSEKLIICRGTVVTKGLCVTLPACISRVYFAWDTEKIHFPENLSAFTDLSIKAFEEMY